MEETVGIEAMAQACLAANELVEAHGTPEMQAIMRILLFQIGQEIALNRAERQDARTIA